MKRTFSVCLALLFLTGCSGMAVAQQAKVPAEVWQKAQTEEFVRVIVQIDVPTRPPGTLSKEAALAQQQAIATAQDELLTELAGTKHRVTRRYGNIPGLGLEVGPDAMAVLERSGHVVKVTEERVIPPILPPEMKRPQQ